MVVVLATAASPYAGHANPPSAPFSRSITTAIVLAHVHQHYVSAPELSAMFRRTTIDASGSPVGHEDGVMWAAPGVFRFDYMRRRRHRVTVSHSTVFDGQVLWSIDHDSRTVTKSALPPDGVEELAVLLMALSPRVASFTATASSPTSPDDDMRLELVPSQAGSSFQLSFEIVTSTWRIREATLVRAGGLTERIQFFNQRPASSLQATRFRVNPAALPRYTLVTTPSPAPTVSSPPSTTNGSGHQQPAPP